VAAYTDNTPISDPYFKSNWALSAAQAASIVVSLQVFGVDPEQMSLVGYGEYHAATHNKDAASRNKNKRVVITIQNEKFYSNLNKQAVNPNFQGNIKREKKLIPDVNQNQENVGRAERKSIFFKEEKKTREIHIPVMKRLELPDGRVKFSPGKVIKEE